VGSLLAKWAFGIVPYCVIILAEMVYPGFTIGSRGVVWVVVAADVYSYIITKALW